jgi:hypothetical protein
MVRVKCSKNENHRYVVIIYCEHVEIAEANNSSVSVHAPLCDSVIRFTHCSDK